MNVDEILKDILGEGWETSREVGEKILAYVDANPRWNRNPNFSKNSVLDAINESLIEIYNHPLSYYCERTRMRERVYVRMKIVGVLRSLDNFSLNECAKMLGYDNHASIVYLQSTNENFCSVDRQWREEYINLKNSILSKL